MNFQNDPPHKKEYVSYVYNPNQKYTKSTQNILEPNQNNDYFNLPPHKRSSCFCFNPLRNTPQVHKIYQNLIRTMNTSTYPHTK